MPKARRKSLLQLSVLIVILIALFLFLHFLSGNIVPESSAVSNRYFSAADRQSDWNKFGATKIILSDSSTNIYGAGASYSDGCVLINRAGKYIISGELTAGQLIVEATKEETVFLLFDGASIHCDTDSAFVIQKARQVFLTLAKGKLNSISVGAATSPAASYSLKDGAIYAKDNLTINGSGLLSVSSTLKHGIVCNDLLKITGGDIDITAATDGIHVHDGFYFESANLKINAGDDGITCENDNKTDLLYVASGQIDIDNCYEGLEASTIQIDGGNLVLTPSDDGINAEKNMIINDGSIRIVNSTGRDADGLDSNGDIFINGGTLFISMDSSGGSGAIDFGSENGGKCVLNGGTVIACGSNMMLESFDESSMQNFLIQDINGEAGTTLTLSDNDSNIILSEVIPCTFNVVTLSSPELVYNAAYTLSLENPNNADNASQTIEVTVTNSYDGFSGRPGGGPQSMNPNGFGGPKDFDGERPEKPKDFDGSERPDKPKDFGNRENFNDASKSDK